MTSIKESTRTLNQQGTPPGCSPKPKPALTNRQSDTHRASSPKPKPCITGKGYKLLFGNRLKLVPLETTRRTDSSRNVMPEKVKEYGVPMAKPLAGKRMSDFQ
jgi:hypothetical protein